MNTPLEDRVHDALHRTADPLQRAPFTVTDVRTRARRIQRRRAVAAGAAVAAVLAVAVPVGLTMTGPAQRSEVPPATQTPTYQGQVTIDPRSATISATPAGVPLLDLSVLSVSAGSAQLDLPKPYEQLTPYRDGWIGTLNEDGTFVLDVLDDSFTVVDETPGASPVAVSPDAERVAWAYDAGDHWAVVNSDVAGQELERPFASVPDGPVGTMVTVVGFVSADEVLVSRLDGGDGTSSYLVADGDSIEPWAGLDQPRSASPVTGMVAARAEDGSCSATFDGRSRSTEPAWVDCTRELGPFSPDGALVVGFAATQGGDYAGLSLLDAATGASRVDFRVTMPKRHVVGIASQVVWEDDEHLLAVYTDNADQYVVRLGVDGSVERVAGPVTVESGEYALRLTPGDVG